MLLAEGCQSADSLLFGADSLAGSNIHTDLVFDIDSRLHKVDHVCQQCMSYCAKTCPTLTVTKKLQVLAKLQETAL